MIYLYSNSEAQSFEGKKGLIGCYEGGGHILPFKKQQRRKKVVTTNEFVFAKEFASVTNAEKFLKKYGIIAIIFERKDL